MTMMQYTAWSFFYVVLTVACLVWDDVQVSWSDMFAIASWIFLGLAIRNESYGRSGTGEK